MTSSSTNAPPVATYYYLQVINMYGNQIKQIAYNYDSDTAWTRRFYTGAGAWTTWVRLYPGTEICYNETTSTVVVAGNAISLVSAVSGQCDGGAILVEWFCACIYNAGGGSDPQFYVYVYMDGAAQAVIQNGRWLTSGGAVMGGMMLTGYAAR